MVKQNGKRTPPAKKGKAMGRPSLAGASSPGERSPLVGVRLAPDELKAVDKLANREGVKRSEMVRRLIQAGKKAYK
jgi:hypothetical protein